MNIVVEFFSVIVPVKIVELKYPGGLVSYKADCPNHSFRSSKYLTRVGFMDSNLLDHFVHGLIDLGFEYDEVNHCSKDFVIAQRLYGVSWGVDWAHYNNGVVTFREG